MSLLRPNLGLRRLSAVLVLGVLPYAPLPAAAEGAVAVGVPPDVSKAGYAYGRHTNSVEMTNAKEHALNNCHTAKDASEEARNLCVVVMTFSNQCIALALDPKAGTPGAGWAIASGREAAERQAMAQCVATAGPSRRDFCKISDSACDER